MIRDGGETSSTWILSGDVFVANELYLIQETAARTLVLLPITGAESSTLFSSLTNPGIDTQGIIKFIIF
jgi:hypothetical protein